MDLNRHTAGLSAAQWIAFGWIRRVIVWGKSRESTFHPCFILKLHQCNGAQQGKSPALFSQTIPRFV